jgi:hypothetical protein
MKLKDIEVEKIHHDLWRKTRDGDGDGDGRETKYTPVSNGRRVSGGLCCQEMIDYDNNAITRLEIPSECHFISVKAAVFV